MAALGRAVENGSLRLCGNGPGVDASQQVLYDELTGFSFLDRDDLADATATGCTHLFAHPQPRVWVM